MIFQRLFAILFIAGLLSTSVSVAQQTGYKQIDRPLSDPSIHEGASGEKSAGFKQNVDPSVGLLPASYIPFAGLGRAIGSLVEPYSKTSPASDHSSIGFKYNFSQLFFPKFSRTNRFDRLFAGFKGLGGRNVTDVGDAGQRCGTGPGDRYWVGYPRPANPQQLDPPLVQFPLNSNDCACRCNEQIFCSVGFNQFIRFQGYGGWNPGPVACQVCYGPTNLGFDAIQKHDIYVGTDHGTHNGYLSDFPTDTGYRECLRQNQGDPSGGSPGNLNYGL